MEIFMSVVKIDYLGTCEELELSTDSYAWWRPFYRWTFSMEKMNTRLFADMRKVTLKKY